MNGTVPAMAELWELTAVDLAARIAAGDVSPVEAVQASLDRIEEINPQLNCFCFTFPERAPARARARGR